MKFEWDKRKEEANIQKHNISFDQASLVFADPFALSLFDVQHSKDEDRWVLLGQTLGNVVLVVVHTFRNEDGIEIVRIISARKATKNEKKSYENRKLK